MLRLARLSIARPRLSLAVWAAVAIALSLVGLGVSDALSPSKATVPGTDSARAEHLANARFGPSQLVPILLEGPQQEVDRQGPILVRKLAARSDTRVMSAWDGGPLSFELHPRPGASMIIAAVARSDREMFDSEQQSIQRLVDHTVSGPVTAYVSGTQALERGLVDASIDTTRTAVIVAIPILFVVLLLLLRAPVAALAVTAFGAVTAFAGFGVVALLGQAVDVAPTAVALGSLGGLTLGVAFALLIYRRWREETAAGATPEQAAATSAGTSGRAVLIGGTALVVAMVLASQVGLTESLTAEGLGFVVCALLAIGAAVVVMPAALVLLGARMTWLSFPAPAFAERAWDRLVGEGEGVVRNAAPMAALSLALMAVLALPVFALEVGPPSPERMPKDNAARVAYDEITRVMGPGWTAPYNMVVVSPDRPLTDPTLIRQIDRLQASIAKDPRTDTVVGPGIFAATSQDLGVLPKKLKESTKLLKGSGPKLQELESGLGKAGNGALQLQAGLEGAVAGAGRLHAGSGKAQSGSAQLHAYLAQARDGSAKLSAGLTQALSGATQLRNGAASALAGSSLITENLGKASQGVDPKAVAGAKMMSSGAAQATSAVQGSKSAADTVTSQLDAALADLKASNDPKAAQAAGAVASARSGVAGISSSLAATSAQLQGVSAIAGEFASRLPALSSGLAQLYTGSSQLTAGITKLRSGNADLAAGLGKLNTGGGDLTSALAKLRDGAGELESGLGQLTAGTGELQTGLSGAPGPAGQIGTGLLSAQGEVTAFRKGLPSTADLERLNRESPGLFKSGYFVLAAIAGARPADRNQAAFAVNLDRGGNAGQIMIVPREGAGSAANVALGESLRHTADRFAATTHTQVALGGQAAQFGDFRSAGTERIWPVIAVVSAVVALLLMALLRTVILPIVTVLCSLLATAVGFGVLQILFGGDDPLMGGPGQFSPISIMGIFAAAFGITTMLQVVLLERTREDYVETGDAHAALVRSLRETAAAATGAAAVMVAALIPFLVSDFLTVAQFGVGVAAAVLVDALVVRPVLLPATLELYGRRAWWPTRPAAGPPSGAPPAVRSRPVREWSTVR